MNQIEEIFNIFLSQIDDEFLALLDEDVLRNQLYIYLQASIVEFKTCKKDLSIEGHVDTVFQLDVGEQAEIPYSDCNIKVTVTKDDTITILKEGVDYSLTQEEESLPILKVENTENGVVNVEIHRLGDIVSELSWEEKYILGLGMVINWVRIKKNTEENMKNIITDSDYKKLSGANMLDKLMKLYDKTEREHRLKVVQYSYSSFKGLN